MTPYAYAHLDHDTIVVEVERERRMQAPLHHIGTLVCFGNIMLSPALIHRCADDGIGIVLLDDNRANQRRGGLSLWNRELRI
jgi:CRISPR-associated protein Cas1